MLTRRLLLERPEVSQNETGEEETTWIPLGSVWATIEPVRGREALIAGANLAIMDTKIHIRWSEAVDAITEKWRASYRGTIYNIVSVAHLKIGRREIELLCRSGASES
jgi:SPP1 family predicted phage head-tail adaptor